MSPHRTFAAAASIFAAATAIAAIIVIGPPWQARDRGLDEQRVRDLQAISAAVEEYRNVHGALPADLEALQRRTPRFPLSFDDAVSGERYGYAILDEAAFEVCARFDAASEPRSRVRDGWEHPSGHHCFELEVPPVPSHNR